MSKEKPVSELSRTSISLPSALYEKALERARELHFANFSDYVQHLLRNEVVFRVEPDLPDPKYPRKEVGEAIRVEESKTAPTTAPKRVSKLPPGKRGIDQAEEN